MPKSPRAIARFPRAAVTAGSMPANTPSRSAIAIDESMTAGEADGNVKARVFHASVGLARTTGAYVRSDCVTRATDGAEPAPRSLNASSKPRAYSRTGPLGSLQPPSAGDSLRWVFHDRADETGESGVLRDTTVALGEAVTIGTDEMLEVVLDG